MTVASRSKINSKQKGARFERHLASLFREYGYDARRTAQYCGNTGDASDVVGLPGLHVEAKHQNTMRLYEWMSQAKRDSEGTGRLPAVFHKKDYGEILVTMTLDDFMNLYREWEAGFDLRGSESDDDERFEKHNGTCQGHFGAGQAVPE
jgi:hypothetical protein